MGRAGVAEELDFTLEEFDLSFAELQSAGMAEADWTSRLVWLPNAVRYNLPDNASVAKAWACELMDLPECDLRSKAATETLAVLIRWDQDAAKAFAEESGLTVPNQEQEEEGTVANLSSPAPTRGNDDGAEPSETPAEEIEPSERKAVPYAEVVDAYHAACPSMPRVTLLNPGRKAAIRARWSEARKAGLFPPGPSERDAGLAFFSAFFARAEASDLLAGRKSEWRASFDWLMGPKNFGKALDGWYDNRIVRSSKKARAGAGVPAARPEDYRVAPFGHVIMRGKQIMPALPIERDSQKSHLQEAKTNLVAFLGVKKEDIRNA
jgi:hypothetical protein